MERVARVTEPLLPGAPSAPRRLTERPLRRSGERPPRSGARHLSAHDGALAQGNLGFVDARYGSSRVASRSSAAAMTVIW